MLNFATAHTAFDTGSVPGGAAIHLARAAEAHLALGDLDTAAGLGTQALRCHSTIDSARGDHTLTTLRAKLARYGNTPAVREFLQHAPTRTYRETSQPSFCAGPSCGDPASWVKVCQSRSASRPIEAGNSTPPVG